MGSTNFRTRPAPGKSAGLFAFPMDNRENYDFVLHLWKEDAMTEKPAAEEYVYHIGKIRFIVTPVYKETGELMRDILLKLMLADLEPV